jgi:hypothetical protein
MQARGLARVDQNQSDCDLSFRDAKINEKSERLISCCLFEDGNLSRAIFREKNATTGKEFCCCAQAGILGYPVIDTY